jgi:hypothetical protein
MKVPWYFKPEKRRRKPKPKYPAIPAHAPPFLHINNTTHIICGWSIRLAEQRRVELGWPKETTQLFRAADRIFPNWPNRTWGVSTRIVTDPPDLYQRYRDRLENRRPYTRLPDWEESIVAYQRVVPFDPVKRRKRIIGHIGLAAVIVVSWILTWWMAA